MTQPIHPMLAKVAAAIFDAEDPHTGDPIGHTIHMADEHAYGDGTDEQQLANVRATCLVAARAAIQALLEPDEGMLSAAREVDSENGWSNNPENIWAAMLKPLLGDEG